MGMKYIKIDESGNKIESSQYDKEAVSYEVNKSRGEVEYIRRTISYRRQPLSRANRFDIWDRTRFGGGFIVSWEQVHVAPKERSTSQGGMNFAIHFDKLVDIKLGEFANLKEAEIYAIKFAIDFGDVMPFFGYHLLFEKEGLTIEDIPTVFNWDETPRDIKISCPVIDPKVIEANKMMAERRLLNKQNRENGMEDTRIMVKVLLNINLGDLNEAIQSHLENEVAVIDGCGNDGNSTYNVDEVDVKVESTGQIEATFYLERESGKFVSAEDLRSEIENQLGSNLAVEVPFEITA